MTRALAPALLLLAAVASAQAVPVDFDGRSSAGLDAAAGLVARARKPRPSPAPSTPSAPPSASVGATVSFHGAALPARAFSRTDRVPDALVAAIDATRSTLRLALYDLNLAGVADAIVRAERRGVDVKLLYDQGHAAGAGAVPTPGAGSQPGAAAGPSGPSAQFTQVVAAGVETRLLKGGGSYGIMHDKIMVCDGELVETGSFNWTNAADGTNFENALFRDDPSLAALYAAAFDWMWAYGRPLGAGSSGDGPFAPPPADPSPSARYKGQPWPRASFSPGGGTEARLVSAIGRATGTLDVAIFSFYSQALADAVVAAKGRGVAVRVVADVSQARRSPQVAQLVSAGVDLRLSGGRGAGGRGVLHHKFALLDRELLATGSYNFSANAENNNFENQFYSDDAGDLSAYQAEFEAVWAQAHAPAPGETQGPSVAVARR
ncbi:MAG: hypothetical protein HY079_09815 [Elusimicrobia bacterium]|nr:hypothetical protein [Elusimicrobiota bacterium]